MCDVYFEQMVTLWGTTLFCKKKANRKNILSCLFSVHNVIRALQKGEKAVIKSKTLKVVGEIKSIGCRYIHTYIYIYIFIYIYIYIHTYKCVHCNCTIVLFLL